MSANLRAVRAGLAGFAGLLVLATAVAVSQGAKPAGADTAPDPGVPATVSADLLPTIQINGVVWSQVTVGNMVYATGSFTRARPPGARSGSNETVRQNLLAYDITTGNLTSFNHSLNAQGRYITASPDGSRVYVGGDFTSVDGQSRGHIAAFATGTGALVAGFAPSISSTVYGLAATNSAVYAGGEFQTASGVARSRLAAFNATDGALLPWNAVANDAVRAVVLAPDQSRVIVGGQFSTLNGASLIGIGAVDPTSGANVSWDPNFPIRDSGANSWITHLSADATQIYGTAFYYTSGGNFEGRFAADPYTGRIIWMNPCHGDSYASIPIGQVLYSVGHAHDCSDIGDFTQDVQAVFDSTHHYALAETTFATGLNRTPVITCCPRYFSFAGQPHSAQLDWYPTLREGTYTGQNQAAWSVTGNAQYVSLGGEFPTVNGVAQQGLARFAIRSIAPNQVAPAAATSLTPTAVSQTSGTARVSWQATADQDNEALTYRLFRDGGSTPIYTTTLQSRFWYRPMLGYLDSQPVGSSHTYRVTATDPLGTVRTSGTSTAVTIGNGSLGSYASLVRSDGAASYWPLTEASGTVGADLAGYNDLSYGGAVTHTAAGPAPTGAARASTFDGTVNGRTATVGNGERLGTFSVEAWVRTASTAGGQIVGYGTYAGANSVNTDRTLYLDTSGRVYFGVYNGTNTAINSTGAFNDDQWHHVVGTVSAAAGMTLYVDGTPVAANPTATSTSVVAGYWRVGGDTMTGWPGAPTGQSPAGYLTGTVSNVAVYPSALSAARVQAHFGDTAPPANLPPTASFTSSCTDLTCSVNGAGSTDSDGTIAGYGWTFGDGSTATGPTASHSYAAAGTYTVTLTVTDDDGATGSASQTVTVTAPSVTTYAADTFNRTVSGGWGTADLGGPWSISSNATNFAVTPGTGTITMPGAGAGTGTAFLGGLSVRDVDLRTTLALDKVPTGNGSYLYLVARRVSSTGQYRARVRVTSTGAVTLAVTKLDGSSTETFLLPEATIAGLSYTPGQRLRVRLLVSGTAPTTLAAKVWADGAAEPTSWQVTATDSSALLAGPGSVGLSSYLSSSATNAPVVQSVTALTAVAPA